jgi:uncharacterized protein DUF4129
MRGRATSVVLPALVVLALVTVVAVASRGSVPGGSSRSRSPSATLLDAFFTLWLLAAVAGGVLLVYGLTQRKAIALQLASGRYRRFSLGGFLFFAGALAIIVQLLRHPHAPGRKPADEEPVFNVGQITTSTPGQKPAADYQAGISWIVVAVVVTLAVVAVLAYVISERRSRAPRVHDLAEELALALDDALDDLRAEADSRRAIIAAYARMERVLAAHGIPRAPAETADEYLARVLPTLPLSSSAVARLTGLFTQAKFSHHEVDTAMKEEAIEALEQVRDELRLAADTEAAPEAEPSLTEATS